MCMRVRERGKERDRGEREHDMREGERQRARQKDSLGERV